MFGQGVGPISGRRGGSRALRMQARAVPPRLAVLGLREDRIGKDLAISLGISSSAMAVTGDDALELIPEGSAAEGGSRRQCSRRQCSMRPGAGHQHAGLALRRR